MNSIDNITNWLKKHGEAEEGSFVYTIKDEPYMEFNAEWQDWSFNKPGAAVLFLGYYFKQNGDLCPDPQLTIHLIDGEVQSVIMATLFGTMDATGDPYVMAFADLVWTRHMKDRATISVE